MHIIVAVHLLSLSVKACSPNPPEDNSMPGTRIEIPVYENIVSIVIVLFAYETSK